VALINKSKPKKKPARLGRPPKPKTAKRAERADGERLNAALQALELSQNAAARLTGIRQGWLTNIINGNRAIGREDLRRLGKLKISADFLLGVEGAPMFSGALRPPVEWVASFAEYIRKELLKRIPLTSDSINAGYEYRWNVRGKEALAFCVSALAAQALTFRHTLRARNTQARSLLVLATALRTLVREWKPTGPGPESDVRASRDSAHAVASILDRMASLAPEIAKIELPFPDWLEDVTVDANPETAADAEPLTKEE